MGKRIEVVPYRPKGGAVAKSAHKEAQKVLNEVLSTRVEVAAQTLAHKRALKAAQMRRWRAKRKAKPCPVNPCFREHR